MADNPNIFTEAETAKTIEAMTVTPVVVVEPRWKHTVRTVAIAAATAAAVALAGPEIGPGVSAFLQSIFGPQ